jgi:WD40 repeat protein
MSAIFISHSSKDAEVAAEMRRWLSRMGHRSVFLDFDPEDGIPAGRNWEQELYQQLRVCRAVIVVCSRHSMASRWCFAEITQARSLGKVLLPVRIDDCTIHRVITDQQSVDMTADKVAAYERLRTGLLAAGLDPTDVFDWDGSRAPYPGLLSFQQEDAAVFFGRDDEVGGGLDLLNKVRRLGTAGVVMVLGASGSGKSSLVRAGLVPRLRRDPERWLVVDPFRPRDDPVRELAGMLSRSFARVGETRERARIRDELRTALGSAESTPANPLLVMARELRILANRSEARILLIVDQFEELLSLPPGHPSTGLLALLRAATEAEGSPVVVLATMRSDFLGAFQSSRPLLDLRYESLSVGPLSAEDISQIIEQPAKIAGIDVEPGLVQRMVADSEGGNALPLLAFTLRELYDQFGSDGRLDVREYRDRVGGLHGAVARVADELIEAAQLTLRQEDELRLAFLAMVRLTDDDRWVRRVVRWVDTPDSMHPVLERFVTARLLTSSGDGEVRTVEVAHEALFRSWGRLVAWLDQNVEALRLRRDLQLSSRSWETGGRDTGDLWRGLRLGRASELTRSGDLPLEELDREFVEASQHAERAQMKKEELRRRRKLQAAVAVAVGASLLTVVAVVFFVIARREADRANEQARQTTALSLSTSARSLLQENPALALALAAEGADITGTPLPQATDALVRARIAVARRSAQQIGEPLTGHNDDAVAVAFSPDGAQLASASAEGSVRLWDTATGDPVGEPLTFHDGFVVGLAFSPGGTQLASASVDGTVRLWDTATGDPVGEPLTFHDGEVPEALLSPDGNRLVFADDDGTLRFWDPTTGDSVGEPLTIHNDDVEHAAFSPDGTRLAIADVDGTVRLWDTTTGEPVGEPLMFADDEVMEWVGFTSDGTRLAFATGEGTVQLWDPDTGNPVGELLAGHNDDVLWVVFSPDGKQLASITGNGETVRLWDRTTRDELQEPLTGHNGSVLEVVFSPDGTLLASASDDNTVRLWDTATADPIDELLTENDQTVVGAAFSRDGTLLASASIDGTVRLWDPATGDQLREPLDNGNPVLDVAFSPDGTLLASASDDGTVRLWDPATGDQLGGPLTSDIDDPVWAVAFSPDGTLLAAASGAGKVQLWDTATRDPVGRPLTGHEEGVVGVAFSPDGTLLASASNDGTVRLWDPATGDPVGEPLAGHVDAVEGVTFSPDGTRLASASNDGTVRLWDPATGDPVGEPLAGHDGSVSGLAFSPDGTLLASAGDDDWSVRLWDPATGDPVGEPLDNGNPVLDVAFSPDGTLLASAGVDLRLWNAVWDIKEACKLAAPYVTTAQVQAYLPPNQHPHACELT